MEFLNFLTWFYVIYDYNKEMFIQVVYSTLKKHWLLNLEVGEVQTGQIFARFSGGDKLINKYFKSKF